MFTWFVWIVSFCCALTAGSGEQVSISSNVRTRLHGLVGYGLSSGICHCNVGDIMVYFGLFFFLVELKTKSNEVVMPFFGLVIPFITIKFTGFFWLSPLHMVSFAEDGITSLVWWQLFVWKLYGGHKKWVRKICNPNLLCQSLAVDLDSGERARPIEWPHGWPVKIKRLCSFIHRLG